MIESVAERLRALGEEIHRDAQRAELAKIKADPAAHKLTRLMGADSKGKPYPASYRYVKAGKDGRGRQVRFCWLCHRNAAGYFLGWKETITKGEGERSDWSASKRKKSMEEMAERRAAAFREKRGGAA